METEKQKAISLQKSIQGWKGARNRENEVGGQVKMKGALSAQKRVTALVYFIQSNW